MKTFAPLIIALAGLISVHAASASVTAPTDTEIKACFEAHTRLMEKPAVNNPVACWRAHGYLMGRS
jgi:hypothetical protein